VARLEVLDQFGVETTVLHQPLLVLHGEALAADLEASSKRQSVQSLVADDWVTTTRTHFTAPIIPW